MSRIFYLQATVFKLYIDKRIIDDANGDGNFIVKIDLIDAPTLLVHQHSDESLKNLTEPCHDNCMRNLDYYAGRACHFTAKRRDVVNALKRKPLKIGIYRENETFPISHGLVPFSGCLCDLVGKSMEEPSPFEFRGIFNLINPGGDNSGYINLAIVLTDLGKHVIASYTLDRDCFVLKNNPEGVEYECGNLKNFTDQENVVSSTIDHCCYVDDGRENFMRDIAGICLDAFRLSRGKPKATIAREPLESTEENINAKSLKANESKKKKKSGKGGKKKKK